MGPHTVLLIAISWPIVFSWISSMVWNLFPFKGEFSSGKWEVTVCEIWAVRGLSHLGDGMFCQNTLHEQVCCHDEAANHRLPVAAALWIIQIVSEEECSSLMQNMMQIRCSTQSFWMPWPHMLNQWCLPPSLTSNSDVIIVHTCTFQSTLFGCQVTLMSHKLFLIY